MSLEKLKGLRESLKTKPCIQVGVFGEKSGRKDSMTNATLASIHEHGDERHGLPARSMLRIPIKDHAAEIMASMKDRAHLLIEKGKLKQAWTLLGIAAEKIVLGAFATEGYGKWPQLTYATLLGKLKGSLKKRKDKIAAIYTGSAKGGILIATGQLRRSFGSRVFMKF